MEGAKRRSDWVPKVKRGYEWSRLEEQFLGSAYECVLPMCPRFRATGQQQRLPPVQPGAAADTEQHQATGA